VLSAGVSTIEKIFQPQGLLMNKSQSAYNHNESDTTSLNSLDIQKLQQLVVKDELTRLYNRRYFRHRLTEECWRCKEHDRPFSLIMADVNDFKEINDRFGHPLGDRVLVEIAGILNDCIREIDIVCRYAGDEFVLILPDLDEEGSRKVADRISQSMGNFPWRDRLEVPIKKVSLTMGFAVFPDDADEQEELIEKADKALYLSKRLNRPFLSSSEGLKEGLSSRQLQNEEDKSLLIGRKEERKKLFRILDQVMGGKGQFTLISGELGVGKSQMLAEVEARARVKGFVIMKGTCFPETQDVPFHPLIQAVDGILKNSHKSKLIREIPENWRVYATEILSSVKRGAEDRKESETGLQEELRQEEFKIFEMFTTLLNTVCSSKPVVLTFENLQWVDPSSIKFLKYIGRQIGNKMIMICGTTRDKGLEGTDDIDTSMKQELNSLREEKFLKEITIGRLKEMEVFAMVEKRIPDGKADRSFKEKIFNLSEGNPLFTKEIINYLIREKRNLLDEEKSWEIETLDEIIPPNIYDLFERNLFNLDNEVKSILSFASVIGQEFEFSILLAISGKNEGYLLDIIDVAVKLGLIKELDQDHDDQYVFTPLLVGRVLYKGLGNEKRRVLHKKVGEVLELIYANNLENYYGVLSNHFQKAGEFKKAIRYASMAGDLAREVYAHKEAIAFYSSALNMLDEAFVPYPYDMAAEFFGKRGKRLFALGEYQRYMDDFSSMLTCSREADRKDLEGKAMVYLSSSQLTRGKLAEAMEWAESALEISRDIDDLTIMMLAYSDLGGITLYLGKFDEALDYYEKSLKLSKDLKDETIITRNLSNIGVYHWYAGDYNEAVRYLKMALKRLEGNGDKHLLAVNFNNLGAIYYFMGKIKESIKAYQESIILSREIKNKSMIAYNYNNLGEIYQVLGLVDQAIKYHKDAINFIREVGERFVQCDILRNLGIDLHLKGKTSEGLKHLKNALRLSRKVGKVDSTLNVLFDLGCVWLESGEPKKAEMISEELTGQALESGNKDFMAKALFLTARILKEKGKRQQALENVEKALKLLSEVQNFVLLWRAYALKWEILEGRNEAKEALEKAVSIIRKIEAELGSQELREGFLDKEEVKQLLSLAT
jgi:diguanylate cyclase (GGDEF)-like protein